MWREGVGVGLVRAYTQRECGTGRDDSLDSEQNCLKTPSRIRKRKNNFAEEDGGASSRVLTTHLPCFFSCLLPAQSLHARKRHTEALEELDAALSLDESNPLARYQRALVLCALDRHDVWWACLSVANVFSLSLQSLSRRVPFPFAFSHSLEELDAALSLDESNPLARYQRALVLCALDRHEVCPPAAAAFLFYIPTRPSRWLMELCSYHVVRHGDRDKNSPWR